MLWFCVNQLYQRLLALPSLVMFLEQKSDIQAHPPSVWSLPQALEKEGYFDEEMTRIS